MSHASQTDQHYDTAIFAGGCFWCMEPPFDKVDGVISSISGYTDGHVDNPTYEDVSSGRSGHTEVVQITYDPSKVSFDVLLKIFWKNIDPTVKNRQFCDVGTQYRTGIYANSEQQLLAAEASKAWAQDHLKQQGLDVEIHTEIKMATQFYSAEDYHQDYYKKNPVRYKLYRYSCGRDARLDELWGDDRN